MNGVHGRRAFVSSVAVLCVERMPLLHNMFCFSTLSYALQKGPGLVILGITYFGGVS